MQLGKQLLELIKRTHHQLRRKHTGRNNMACSCYEYVKDYERDDSVLRDMWIMVRIAGRDFCNFSRVHDFEKPNDTNTLNLMNHAAVEVMEEFRDIVLAYGQSDEFSFVFRLDTNLFNRRAFKLLSHVTSSFSTAYKSHWSQCLPQRQLRYDPGFTGRLVTYPRDQNLRDYLSWRQDLLHVNNLYNTVFWKLVLQSGLSEAEAADELRGTSEADKNELLYARYDTNYNTLPALFRKGTTLLRKRVGFREADEAKVRRQLIVPLHVDMSGERFWKQHAELLSPKYKSGEHVFEEHVTPPTLLTKQLDKFSIGTKVIGICAESFAVDDAPAASCDQSPAKALNAAVACSRFEAVKDFERDDSLMPNVWCVVRIDGKGFHKFAKAHDFEKPNDASALNLMNSAAVTVMKQMPDIVLAYGQSDEYSFVFRKTKLFNRSESELNSSVTSLFSTAYLSHWSQWLPQRQLLYTPSFDGRVVLYPSDAVLRDYLSWRQADVHVNNLYNTAFWNLVLRSGLSNRDAEAELRGTFAADKTELLLARFGIDYNALPAMFRKGTTLLRKRVVDEVEAIVPLHEDMIGEQFWQLHTELLAADYRPGEHIFEKNVAPPTLLTKQLEKLSITKKSERQEQIS